MLNSQSKNFRVSLMSTLAKFEEGSTSQLWMLRSTIRTKEFIPQILERFLTYSSQLSESLTQL